MSIIAGISDISPLREKEPDIDMVSVEQASRLITEAMFSFGKETVKLDESCGRVLHQSVEAERDQPPFNRVTMDGIAISFDSFASGNRKFAIESTQHAGDQVQQLTQADHCIEIMTGGVLPRGTDCVIPVERISIKDNYATLENSYTPERNQFVHPQGSDHLKGHVVLLPGSVISPMDIAIIASCGLESITVSKQPSIQVISTGNELVQPGIAIEDHQIRMSNGPALVAMLTQHGFTNTAHEHLIDDPDILEMRLGTLLSMGDVVVLSGGVSMGKADHIPEVLANLGVDVVFHKISQQPGKPMWFGIGPAGQPVFALPGNPVSTLVCCRHYVIPALLHAINRQFWQSEFVVLTEEVTFKTELTCFMPVRLSSGKNGSIRATPAPTNTSGDFTSLTGTDGYVELAKGESLFDAGTAVPMHRWTIS